MADIIENLKLKYKTGSVLTKIILINVIVFVILKVIEVFLVLFNINTLSIIDFLGVPSNLALLINRFWTPITYMFVHVDFLHILFNMLWLYWFGKIFMQYFTGRTLGSLYILGGLAGALLYVLSFNTIPYYLDMGRGWMIGASAAVMAIVMGSAFYKPDLKLNLLFIGEIKIVYIALFAFILDFLSLGSATNPGGHVAHIGGALLGYLFATQYLKDRDITGWMSKLIDWVAGLFKPRKKKVRMKVSHNRKETDWDFNYRKNSQQEEIDAILDKLKKSGYSGLSTEEKKKLFDASKK